MTIYTVRWKNTANNTTHTHACSSFVKAQAILKQINANPDAQVITHSEEDVIEKFTPKSQADVIDLINKLC